jgi:integrase
MSLDVIIKQNTRIMTPDSYFALRVHLNPEYKIICDVLLNTAMRVEELRWFSQHPEAYKASRRCISLTKSATKKVKVVRNERDIMLTLQGCEAVELFIKVKPYIAQRAAMGEALKFAAEAAGIGSEGITPKMFRKTYLSWLVAASPENYFLIAMSAGHTLNILQKHYAGIAFQREDVMAMRAYVKGWGGE